MYQRAHHRVQRADDGQDDGCEVQRHGEGHVQLDGGHHPVGKGDQVGQLLYLVVHQGNVRRVHGDVMCIRLSVRRLVDGRIRRRLRLAFRRHISDDHDQRHDRRGQDRRQPEDPQLLQRLR